MGGGLQFVVVKQVVLMLKIAVLSSQHRHSEKTDDV
jgi:hypothetical protein